MPAPTHPPRPVRARLPLGLPFVLLGLLGLLASCGGGGGGGVPGGPTSSSCGGAFGPCGGGSGPLIQVQGRIRYERLVLGPAGLGPGTELRPARFVDVEVRASGGTPCYGRTSTDANGDYVLLVTPDAGTEVEVAVFSRTSASPAHDLTVHRADPPTVNSHNPNDVFCHGSAPFVAQSRTVDLTVPYGSDPVDRPSMGFGLLDVLVGQVDGAQAALGQLLPALHAYTRIGNNAVIFNTSYYSDGAKAIAILGGAAGMPDTSDTDYFDDGVIAHEFHHFLARTVSHSWSRGGAHGGQELEPNFAWSEGLATGFGQLLLGQPRYTDTANTNALFVGSVLFSMTVENATLLDGDGIGDEFTVAEILWDLADDATPTGDTDADGVSVPLADLYAALDSFDPATDGPYIGLFLERLVGLSGAIDDAAMADFLDGTTGPEDQQISHPAMGTDVFPTSIAVGGSHGAVVSSIPTGPGTPNPCRQRASSHWYHLVLPVGQTISIDLQITGIPGSGNDLDLYLCRNEDAFIPVAQSAGTGPLETIGITLPAGTYIIRVEADCSSDNEASYTLNVN